MFSGGKRLSYNGCSQWEDAIHKFTENKDTIRLLLFDVVMPKVKWHGRIPEIKKMRPGIKTIFMSGFNNDIINENILKNEDTYFISKPILPINLLEKVKKL